MSDFGGDPPPMAEQLRYLVLENRDLKADVVRLRGEAAELLESHEHDLAEMASMAQELAETRRVHAAGEWKLNGRTAEEWARLAEQERERAERAGEQNSRMRTELERLEPGVGWLDPLCEHPGFNPAVVCIECGLVKS